MREGFSLSIDHLPGTAVINCAGDLDLLPAEKLREAVETVFTRDVTTLRLDCSRVSLLNSAGITALVDTAISCRERSISLELLLSSEVRRILDVVGLWWLGVVDDGIAVEESLQRALRVYADQSFSEPGGNDPTDFGHGDG